MASSRLASMSALPSYSMRFRFLWAKIQHAPFLRGEVQRVLQRLEYEKATLATIAMEPKCRERERVRSVVRKVEAALDTQLCILGVLDPGSTGAQ